MYHKTLFTGTEMQRGRLTGKNPVRRVFRKDLIFTVLRVSLNLCMAVIGDMPTGDPP